MPQAAVGVMRFQHRVDGAMARPLAGAEQAVTEWHLLAAQALVAVQARALKGVDYTPGPA
jgi:hypothetical protein